MKYSFVIILALIFCLGCTNPNSNDPSVEQTDSMDILSESTVKLADKSAVKKAASYAEKWLEFTYQEQAFMSCYSFLPSYGVSRINVECWVQRTNDNSWEQVLKARTYAVGNGELLFDSKTGILQFKGKANNKLKGLPVITFNLQAIEI